ncbi:elongation factor P [Spirochaeta isovalerica]|uniref:Elongation factor P n=1 Tax=Spirochaeta isovalerica TaxID=150 RepID=A0A841R5T1_9SPIO|nr:elongation factor P [Spirochaeta isovalerica]MBB6478379.1 elongation factor P [Spirochaeta isovalerica]
MSQIKAGAIEKGMFLLEKDAPYLVVERDFVNPGKGSSFVRLKLKNLRNASVLKVTHKTQDNIEEIDVEDVDSQFLYSDGSSYHFMNSETFDQYEVPVEGLEDKGYFMREGETFRVVRWNNEALDIKLPPKMDLIVTEAEDGVKGDTVTGATKYVTVETGLTVKVPIFIKQGEKIRINVETKEYQERINN